MNGFNFTTEVRATFTTAREEAARRHHGYVGTEHLLFALIAQNNELLAEALRRSGSITLGDLRTTMEGIVHSAREEPQQPDLPYTSRAKKAISLTLEEAASRGETDVTPNHLLLGLLREEGGIAAQALVSAGVTLDVVRAIMGPSAGPTAGARQPGDFMMAYPVRGDPSPYILLSGLVFALVAVAQLTRALMRWPLVIAGVNVPTATSYVAFVVATVFALWAFRVRRR